MLFHKHTFTLLFSLVILISACSSNNDAKEEEIYVEGSLPKLEINTLGNEIPKSPKIDAKLSITVGSSVNFDGNIAIETRGGLVSEYPKKSYSFETRDNNNIDLDVSLLGFPLEEDWILYGPYSDKTLLRNSLAFTLYRNMGNYASRTAFTELYVNDEYQGVYILLEKLKRDDNRINISKLNPDENSGEDLTGGYILIVDNASKNNSNKYFTSAYNPPNATNAQSINFVFEEPGYDELSTQQRNYITTYVSEFEDALSSPNFTDPVNGYLKYTDVSSFIDFFLINELANNVNAYRANTYLIKDKNEKLAMGPIWDFNYAFGNANFCDGDKTNVWAYTFNTRCSGEVLQVPFWWSRLLEDPSYVTQLKSRWQSLRNNQFSETSLHNLIDEQVAILSDANAVTNNFNRWDILGSQVYPNSFIGTTYAEEVTYMKDWISNRLSWLDTEISKL